MSSQLLVSKADVDASAGSNLTQGELRLTPPLPTASKFQTLPLPALLAAPGGPFEDTRPRTYKVVTVSFASPAFSRGIGSALCCWG